MCVNFLVVSGGTALCIAEAHSSQVTHVINNNGNNRNQSTNP